MTAKYRFTVLIIIGLIQFTLPSASYGATNSIERMAESDAAATLRPQERASWKMEGAVVAAVRCQIIYVVRYGETLYSIAARCGVTVAILMRANGLRSARVWPGQRLYIPTPKGGSTAQPTPSIHRPPAP